MSNYSSYFVKLRCLEYDETSSNGCLGFTPSNSVVLGTHSRTLPQRSYETHNFNTTMTSFTHQKSVGVSQIKLKKQQKYLKTAVKLNYYQIFKVRD